MTDARSGVRADARADASRTSDTSDVRDGKENGDRHRSPRQRVEDAVAQGASSPLEIAAATGLSIEFSRLVVRELARLGRIDLADGLRACKAVDPDAANSRTGCATGSCASCPIASN